MSENNWNQFGKTPVPIRTGDSNRDAGLLIDSLKADLDEAVYMLVKYCANTTCDNCLFFDSVCEINYILAKRKEGKRRASR